MRSKDIDELMKRANAFDKIEERLHRDRLGNTFTRMDEISAKMILRDQRQLGQFVDQLKRISAPESAALASLASLVRSDTYKSINQTVEAIARMSFGREGQLDALAIMRTLTQSVEPRFPFDRLLKDEKKWGKTLGTDLLSNTAVQKIARAATGAQLANLDVLLARLKATDLINTSPRLTERLLEPTFLHTRFTTETIARLAKTTSVHESRALQGSLTLFNDQLLRLNTVVSPFITRAPRRRRGHSYEHVPDLDLPSVQQEELLAQDELPADAGYEVLSPLAPSSFVADDALACIMLYERCNDACRFQGRERIFTPTTKGTVAASLIALLVADSREQFDYLIDQLYMLFYEGAGGTKNKLLKENGGVMERPECEALWDIKQLRSKRSRHDIEHGSEGEIRKKFRDVSKMYIRLGLSRLPQNPEEFKLLHAAVIGNLKELLNEVAQRLEKDEGTSVDEHDER